MLPEAGISYKVHSAYWRQILDLVSVKVNVRKPNSFGSANVTGKYIHTILTLGLPFVTIDSGGLISISGGLLNGYSTITAYTSFDY